MKKRGVSLMANFGKANATGRSTGRLGGRMGKLMRPPTGESWVWITKDLMESDAWRMRTNNCRKFIDALMADHMAHAGLENGALKATYSQLSDIWGIRCNSIYWAIREAVMLGLVHVTKEGGCFYLAKDTSEYRLTWLPERGTGMRSNEWKGATADAITAWHERRKREQDQGKKQKASNASDTDTVTLAILEGGRGV